MLFLSCISTFEFLIHNSLLALIIRLFGKWFAAWEIKGNPSYLGDHTKHRGKIGSKPGDRPNWDNL